MHEAILSKLGKQIRAYRLSHSLTLEDLAKSSGISKGLLSRIENGRTLCSIPILLNILKSLSVSLPEFFSGIENAPEDNYFVIKERDYTVIEKECGQSGFNYRSILNKMIGIHAIEIVLLEIKSGIRRNPVQTDAYEYKYILEGQVNYHLNDKIIVLEKGDSLFFDGRIPHFPYNASDEDVKMLVIYFYTGAG